MSPATLRRYRAERLLRQEFEGLRAAVISAVSSRLRSAGVSLDPSDIEEAYAQAWQGLYAAVLDGRAIASPAAWLTLVTYRRALDQHRARRELARGGEQLEREDAGAGQRDLAAEFDDRVRLRELFEALRGRLSVREQQAATLCYLQGLSRSEAATRMGVSETRMRKLMEGRGSSSPGVSGKVGALIETIRAGRWCEEQGSLMRAFAYGILDPQGERYRLALLHRSECPACRAYVLSLRGLAALLPPAPWLVQWTLGAAAGAGSGAGAAAGAGTGIGAAAPSSSGAGAGALSVSGAGAGAAGAGAAAGAAGGSWWIAGAPFGAKLAASCLLALGVGAGCVALDGHAGRGRVPAHHRHAARGARESGPPGGELAQGVTTADGGAGSHQAGGAGAGADRSADLSPTASAARLRREFGPEQGLAGSASTQRASAARSTHGVEAASAAPATAGPGRSSAGAAAESSSTAVRTVPAGGEAAAQREFAPG